MIVEPSVGYSGANRKHNSSDLPKSTVIVLKLCALTIRHGWPVNYAV